MQTIEGARKARDTQIRKHGSVEAWVAFMREQAARGGKLGKTGGFYHMKQNGQEEKIKKAGAKGGRISRRGPSKES